MTVKTGRYIIRRAGVEVDASGDWRVGPATSSADVAGVEGSVTWHRTEPVSVMETDHTDADYRGDEVTIHWVDEDGEVLVFTGTVGSTSGESLAEATSRLTDGTARLTRSLDLRPMAYTLPVHPVNAEAGGRLRRVGLFGIWFTHQAMVHAGFDPGVPMHWSSVWYQSMCGSVATVPDKDHAFASLGDLRSAQRLSNPDVAPGFVQGETQIVAEDVFTFGVTTPPKPGSESLPWQLTWDLPIVGGIDGEIVLRNLGTAAGLAVKWSTNNLSVYKHNPTGTQELLGTVVRDRNLTTGDKRWSIVAAPSGTTVVVRTDARGEVARWEGAGTIHPLPTGKNGLCTVRTSVPGRIGATAVTRGDRHYMTTEPPKGRIFRADLTATSLPGWPNMPSVEAGRVLSDQADAHRGLRAQPIWSWIDHEGLLVNADFDTLAARAVVMEFDTRPDSGDLALDSLAWETTPPGGPYSSVEVTALRQSVARRSRPSLLLAEGSAQSLQHGDDYEVFLHPESGTTWLEPDLRPLMAGYPYPSPPYHPGYKNYLNGEIKTWLGGHRFFADGGERRGWLLPYQMSWTVDALGHVQGAIEQLDPATVLVTGKAVLPQGQWPQDASTSPDPGSEGLGARRKDQPFPQLRGYGLMREVDASVTLPVDGVDDRHPPYSHDCGSWIQSGTGMSRIGDYLHEAITRPTPRRTARVEQTGRVRAGDKVLLRERRRNGIVIEEEVVLGSIAGATHTSDDAMTVEGIVVARRVVQTDPDAPPVDQEEEWITPPPVVPPAPPRDTTPPRREDDPIHDPEDPPGAGPVKPSAPTLAYDTRGLLTVRWDGMTAAGGSAVTAYFGAAEVALAKDATPTEVVGLMWDDGNGAFLFTEPSVDYGSQWWARIRVTDRWGRVSPWSDVTGPVEVVPLVDPEQFEELRDRLADAEIEIAETGAELDLRIDQAQADLAAANNRLTIAEADLAAAFGGLEALAASGANLVPDGDMETSLAEFFNGASQITDESGAYSGARFGRFPANTGGVAVRIVFPWVQAEPGMILRAGFAAKRNGVNTSGTLRFAIEVQRADGSTTTSYTGTAATPETLDGTWQVFTQPNTVTLPADAVRWRARPYYSGDGTGLGSFDIDMVTVYDITNASALEAAQDRLDIAEHQINTVFPTRFGNIDDAITVIQDDVSAIETATGQKIVTSPTPPDPATTDIWIDTSATPAVPKFYDGTAWEPLTNPDAIADALAAAKEHANNLPKVLHGTGPATGDAPDGSVWFQHEGTIRGRVTAQWVRDSSTWVETPIDSQAIANLDVGKLTAGSASISDLVAERIAAKTGQFLSLDVGQLVVDEGVISNLVAEHFAARTSSLIQADIGNLVVTGSSTMTELVATRLWGELARFNKVTTDMLLVGNGVNLVPNGNMALGTAGWSSNWTLNTINAKSIGYPGSIWLEGTQIGQGDWFPVEGGKNYRVTVWVRADRAGKTFTLQLLHDGTGAVYPFAATPTVDGAYQEYTTAVTMPDDATTARVQVYANHGSGSTTDGYQWFTGFHITEDIASLIVTGTIDASHINAESIAAEIGEFVYVEANHIKSGLLESTITISGRVQTAESGRRAQMDANGFQFFDSNNNVVFRATTNRVEVVGDMLLSGSTGRITTAASGARVELQGSTLRSYDANRERTRLNSNGLRVWNNNGREILNASGGSVSLVGELSTGTATRGIVISPSSSYLGAASIELRHENFLSQAAIALESASDSIGSLTLWGPVASVGSGARSRLRLEQRDSSKTRIFGLAREVLLQGDGQIALESQGVGGRILARAGSNELLMRSDDYVHISGIGSGSTTTQAANTHTALDGRIRRTSSLSEHKLAQEDLADWEAVKALRPITWYDRAEAEALAEAIDTGEGMEHVGHQTQQVGLIAEEVEATGATGLAVYDNDGSLSGVAYERGWIFTLPWLHDLDRRITALEETP